MDLATGRPPRWPGHADPATALAAAPVAPWPPSVSADDGRRLPLEAALGVGGGRVRNLLDTLVGASVPEAPDVDALGPHTPAGTLDLPVTVMGAAEAVKEADGVDPAWLRGVEGARAALRAGAVAAGRARELEAAVHLAMLVATDRFDPGGDDADAHVASGARLWLLTGAVAAAVAGADPDPFDAWARLVVAGWWPVGPVGGRIVVAAPREGP